MRITRRMPTALVGTLAVAALSLCACGSDSDDGGGNVTLNVQLFGSFGYKESGLFDEYQKLHPNISIKFTSVQQESTYWPKIQSQLNAPTGVGDVYAAEVSRIAQVTQNQADRWVDLKTFGAGDLEADYYDWKWKAGTTADGKILGLGTDIGPLAICYRKDLFAKAGLPTDRQELAKSWTSWQAFLDLGKQYKAKAPRGSAFVDTAGGLYNAILGSSIKQYYDESGKPIHETNPAIRDAWNLGVQAAQTGLTARLKQFDEAWNKAFSSGSFASIACPSWMISYIKGQDKNGSGKWDVAPGPGVGNWGGSYLGIPKNSRHQKESYDLIRWLTAPDQQVRLFQDSGIFPASKVAASRPEVADAKDPYFGDAPVGKIFGDVAQNLPVAVHGPRDGSILDAFNNGLLSIETQKTDPDKAWKDTMKNVENLLG
ncbi:MAG: cellobiose transport system substrate-binding protein [Actinomycetota bacterium]|nr:cellobiose transport system substrate-binding protein [Actinomycetota bacterium]